MLGNRALQALVPAIYTTTGSTTLGFAPGNVAPPDLLVVSAASAVTVTLPIINPANNYSLAMGGNQIIRVMNLNTQAVTVAANAADSILGSSATIAANATGQFVSAGGGGTNWYRISG